jgi:hypothetical protein
MVSVLRLGTYFDGYECVLKKGGAIGEPLYMRQSKSGGKDEPRLAVVLTSDEYPLVIVEGGKNVQGFVTKLGNKKETPTAAEQRTGSRTASHKNESQVSVQAVA